MAYPQITYYFGSQLVTLPFTFPPIENAGIDENGADEYEAIRTDSVTSSGLVQSVTEREDAFRTLKMSNVPIEDIPAWAAFMRYALQGFTFNYFPDADDNATVFLCTLAETSWTPKWNMRLLRQFTFKMRLASFGQNAGEDVGTGDGGGGTAPAVPPIALEVTAPNADDFTIPHGLGKIPTAVIPVETSPGIIRLQPTGWDATNVYLNASAAGLTAVVYLFQ